MSKVGKSNGGVILNDIKPIPTSTTTRVTRASSNAAAAVAASKSIVSIEVNMEATFDNQCTLLSTAKQQAMGPPLAAVKKKRSALGNISNAADTNSLQQSTAVSQSSNGSSGATSIVKDVAKKYRFGGANIANVIPSFGAKKTAVDLPKKTSIKSSSKENLNQIQQPKRGIVTKKNSAVDSSTSSTATTLTKTAAVSKSENDIKKQVDSLSLTVEVNSSTSTTSSSSSSSSGYTTVSSLPTIPSVVSLEHYSMTRQALRPDQVSGWEDIDANEFGDEFTCADYATNIFKYYRDREDVFPVHDYLNSPHANINRQMRFLLVDWMVEVQQQLEFNHEVLYLSVKLLDLYLTRQLIDKEKLQLLAAAAMFIACKFEERMPPVIEDFIIVSDHAYARRDVIKMEIEILKTVRFDLGVPLSYTFLRRYSKCIRADMKFLTLARYILELSLQDYSFAPERDSIKACAALYLAMKMAAAYEAQATKPSSHHHHHHHDLLNSPPVLYVSTSNLTSTEWNPTLIHYTNAFVHDFIHLVPLMNNLVKNAPSSKYKTIYKKYSHPVFFEVAKVPALNDFQVELLVSSNQAVRN